MENNLDKQEVNKPLRDEKGRILPGSSGNLNGRPKGKTLKEWLKDKLQLMTEDEREAFLKGIPKEMQWKMAEGNPASDVKTDITSGGEVIKGFNFIKNDSNDKTITETGESMGDAPESQD